MVGIMLTSLCCLRRITEFYTDFLPDLIYSHTGYDDISYFWSAFIEVENMAENAVSDGFVSNFSGAAFFLPNQPVGFLLIALAVLSFLANTALLPSWIKISRLQR